MSALLELDGVVKTFTQKRGGKKDVQAVAGVSLTVARGETVGLVGESGCGKSTLARLALKLLDPTAGRIRFDGVDITESTGRQLLPVRRRLQAVFQDPLASLNSRMTIAEIMREPFDTHGIRLGAGLTARIRELLSFVGMENTDIEKLPPQFSGGQLQRIAIARALMPGPKVLIADEPVSALDVSIQAQVLNLLKDLVKNLGLGLVFIAHDLSVVAYTTSRVSVMSSGKIVEVGKPLDLFSHPQAEATRNLVGAILSVESGLAGNALA
jgi:ABC-type oligopeptide transport system ATPase subunit